MKALFLASFLLAFHFVYSQAFLDNKKAGYSFIENKGQVYDQNYTPNPEVKYLLSLPGMNIQLRANGYSYDTYTVEREESQYNAEQEKDVFPASRLNFHRVDVNFIGTDAGVMIQALDMAEGKLNYYNAPGGENGFLDVRHYNKVVYKGIYPDTDLEFVVEGGKMKFNFILGPLADAAKIQWEYSGQNGLSFLQNSPLLQLDAGEIRESIPYSFIKDNKETIEIQVRYKNLHGNVFGFQLDGNLKIIAGQELIIDPVPEQLWGTYFGDVLSTSIEDLKVTVNDKILLSGATTCVNNIATSGAFKTTLSGTNDAILSKLDNNGYPIWSTYYGGSGTEWFRSVFCDNDDNIIAAGLTNSTTAISTSSAFQSQFAGTMFNDAFLVKFSPTGQRQWATYYGGIANENNVSVITDSSKNIYLSGRTLSDTMHMTTFGAHQMANQANNGEAPYQLTFLAKFSPTGTRIWGTYIRGTAHVSPVSVLCDSNNYIIIGGTTSSYDSISTPGSWQTIKTNQDCGWIMKFNTNGQRIWGTFYGGNGGSTWPYNICNGENGTFYLVGNTQASTGIASNNAFQTTKSQGSCGFIAKFDNSGQRLWGTYYGGISEEIIYSITTDLFNDVLVAGYTNSNNNIASLNSMKTIYQDYPYYDAFIVKFDSSGQRKWGTYYGGVKDDYAYAIRISKNNTILVSGKTKSTTGIATLGAFKMIQGSNGSNETGFITRLSDCTESTIPVVTINTDSICKGEAVRLGISGSLNGASHWAVFHGNILIDTTSTDSIWITPAVSGYYKVKGAGGCVVVTDADSVPVFVNLPALNAGGTQSICHGQALIINAQHAAGTLNWSNGLHNGDTLYLPQDTLFTVSLTDSMLCTNIDTLRVKVLSLPLVYAGNDTGLCKGSSLVLNAYGSALTYIWNDSIANGSIFTADSTRYMVVTGSDSNQCVAKDSLLLTTWSLPSVSFQNSFHQMCHHHPAQLLNGGMPAGGTYTGSAVTGGVFYPSLALNGWNGVLYTYTDTNGCTNAAHDSIYVDSCLYVTDYMKQGAHRLYPNPAGEYIILELMDYKENCIFEIFCLSGQKISESPIETKKNYIKTSHLPAGVYQYRITNSNGIPCSGLLIKE